jgi:hypothetical protein
MAISGAETWKYDDDGEMSAPDIGCCDFRGCPTLQKRISRAKGKTPHQLGGEKLIDSAKMGRPSEW